MYENGIRSAGFSIFIYDCDYPYVISGGRGNSEYHQNIVHGFGIGAAVKK